MSTKRQNAVLIGGGAAACAACCAGPILGFLAAIGLGTAVGAAVFGAIAIPVAALVVVIVLRRRTANVHLQPSTRIGRHGVADRPNSSVTLPEDPHCAKLGA